ncbi:membrane fusion protein (multidrug efflux system) [Fluviicoccus keumensis]|uniref:Membrane fusion protein (Multidrug efflux system) n=1 Tax=Fluviicoccus keumensis TaxID=1435465 RepID=A0A4Q7ZBG7_9GAMM|nr:membrane fusion protein (multidrug efflux system) [Fluviicoccus keumensis]
MKYYTPLFLSLFCLAPVTGLAADKPRPPPVVEVVQVAAPMAVAPTLQAIGSIRPSESIMLKPEVSGRVVSLGFREGQLVRKGDMLVKLDDSLLKAELPAKEAAVVLAEAEYKRLQLLAQSQQVADIDVERKRVDVALAKAASQLLNARIKQTELRAPFDGVIGIRQFSIGDVVQSGQALVSLSNFKPVKMDVKLPEGRADVVRLNQRVDVRVDALPGLLLKGRVAVIEPQLDAGTRALWARVELNAGDPRIRSGMSATVSIPLPGGESGSWLPEQALVAQGGKQVVFKVVDGKALAAPVRVGQRQPGKVEILAGVKAGDTVVVSGQNKLSKPEMPIKAVPMAGGW